MRKLKSISISRHFQKLSYLTYDNSGGGNTWRSARSMAMDKALERGERPSGVRGELWSAGMDSFSDLNRSPEELVDSTFILSVSSLKAPTNSITIFPPPGTSATHALGDHRTPPLNRLPRRRRKRGSRRR